MQRLSDTLRDTYKLGLMIIYGLQMVLLLMFATTTTLSPGPPSDQR
jgi:hypothetical protein